MGFLDNNGLNYLWSKLKSKFVPVTRTINGQPLSGDITIAGIPLIRQATFDGLAWNSQGDGTYTQTLTVQGVTANSIVFVTPTDAYKDTYIAMNCEATSQGANTVTFTCTNPLDTSIVMSFIIF